MGAADIFWMVVILAGAGYLFYRSVIKKKGHCTGCGDTGCVDSGKKSKAGHGV